MENNLKECDGCKKDRQGSNRTEKVTKSLTIRLNRIEGQVRGIKGMVEKGVYCDDILTQISAVQSAMKSVSKLLLESHMRTCIVDKIKAGEEEALDEVLKTIERMMK
ncbi:metal-sensing transcriptional repressor [Lutibacter sp. B2]|nr:metal-sensing transcriptional repressor [Lutibacter sp. B2]